MVKEATTSYARSAPRLDKRDVVGNNAASRQPVTVIFWDDRRSMSNRKKIVTLFFAIGCSQATAQPLAEIHAQVKPVAYHVPVGRPVLATMLIENLSDKPVTLTVPGAEPAIPSPEMGLPISHVFSGGASSGVVVMTESGRQWEKPVGYRPSKEAPILLLAPRSTVGTTIDLREYFPALRTAGEYRVSWAPYGGVTVSDPVRINIAPLKRVRFTTDEGPLVIELFYEDAPNAVANFVELVESGFYAGSTFHRIEPGYMLQGGCARGDGTGVRPDGHRIGFEHNERHHDKGTVSMALLDDDPDSASSQFFISYTRQSDWDGRYTIFGKLVGDESFATLDQLMSTEVDEHGRPRRTLYIRAARTISAPSEPPASYP